MAETPSNMLALGTAMPSFKLPSLDGTVLSSSDLQGKPVVVVFMCNHCPFVKHVMDVLAEKARAYRSLGVSVVGINSNDVEAHPEDSPEKMKEFAVERGMDFPYLFDESQQVAKVFQAACTPDFFLFDGSHRLVYRGQFDDSRPSNGIPVSGADLTAAVEAVAADKSVSKTQKPSLGCNIKWRKENQPESTTFRVSGV